MLRLTIRPGKLGLNPNSTIGRQTSVVDVEHVNWNQMKVVIEL